MSVAVPWCAPAGCGFGHVRTAGTPSLLNVIVSHRRDGVLAVRYGNNDGMRHRCGDFGRRRSPFIRTIDRRLLWNDVLRSCSDALVVVLLTGAVLSSLFR